MESIAAIVITKDEERNIAACLESLKWADEMIVVDAESTDRTAELAKAYTPKVYVRTWPGYGPQKNFAMAQAASNPFATYRCTFIERNSTSIRSRLPNDSECNLIHGPVRQLFIVVLNPSRHADAVPCSLPQRVSALASAVLVSPLIPGAP